MNAELEQRWRRGEAPFDGPVLVATDWLAESALPVIVRRALDLMRSAHGTTGLNVNKDWHDHDGFIDVARPVSWDDAASWSQSVEQLRASCSDDWLVHTLLFPDDFGFCLRYWVEPDEGDDEREGRFDLCTRHSLLQKLAGSLRADGVNLSVESSAKDYFDRQWGG